MSGGLTNGLLWLSWQKLICTNTITLVQKLYSTRLSPVVPHQMVLPILLSRFTKAILTRLRRMAPKAFLHARHLLMMDQQFQPMEEMVIQVMNLISLIIMVRVAVGSTTHHGTWYQHIKLMQTGFHI